MGVEHVVPAGRTDSAACAQAQLVAARLSGVDLAGEHHLMTGRSSTADAVSLRYDVLQMLEDPARARRFLDRHQARNQMTTTPAPDAGVDA